MQTRRVAVVGPALSARILAECTARGWTLRRLAREAGLPPRTVWRMGRAHVAGRASLATVEAVAHALGLDVAELLREAAEVSA